MSNILRTVTPINPTEERPQEFINSDGIRNDKRKSHQFRDTFTETGVTSAARGSAYIEMDNTKVICSVYGPRQIMNEFTEQGRLTCEIRFATFSQSQRRNRIHHKNREEEKQFAIAMREALETSVCLDKFPKSSVDIYAMVLEADGGVLSSAITCASLALADAGIEMYDMIAACSASYLQSRVVVDPTAIEEKYGVGGIVCSYMPSQNAVTQLTQSGEMSYEHVVEAIELCIDGCTKIHQKMRTCLLKKVKQGFEQN
eukprot:gb/GECH01007317.1/.p1 GENE.gb/GECH01007317.1/~~gb/GECH01007317.1/.p1  ORF type:complete len:257 (+),score=56.38 gb/GECH01007317.1/:1-771(+)